MKATELLQAEEELDLAVPDMAGEHEVRRGSAALAKLPGIVAVRLVERGVFVRYRPAAITKEEIAEALRQAGFRASTFQDSASGKTGRSSQ
jgi:copper chaperone CopZ